MATRNKTKLAALNNENGEETPRSNLTKNLKGSQFTGGLHNSSF